MYTEYLTQDLVQMKTLVIMMMHTWKVMSLTQPPLPISSSSHQKMDKPHLPLCCIMHVFADRVCSVATRISEHIPGELPYQQLSDYLFMHASIFLSTFPSIHAYIHPSFPPLIHLPIHPFVHSSIYPPGYPFSHVQYTWTASTMGKPCARYCGRYGDD